MSGVMVYVNHGSVPDTFYCLSPAVRLFLQLGNGIYRLTEDKAGAPGEHRGAWVGAGSPDD